MEAAQQPALCQCQCHYNLFCCQRQTPDEPTAYKVATSSHKASLVHLLPPQAGDGLVIPTQPLSSQTLPESFLWTSGVHVIERDGFICNHECWRWRGHRRAGRTGCTRLPRLGSAIIGSAGPQGCGAARCCRALALPRFRRCRPPCKAQADQTLLCASHLGKALGPLPAKSGCIAEWPNDTRCRSSRSSLPNFRRAVLNLRGENSVLYLTFTRYSGVQALMVLDSSGLPWSDPDAYGCEANC